MMAKGRDTWKREDISLSRFPLYKLRFLRISSIIVSARPLYAPTFKLPTINMFKSLLFAGLLAVAMAAPSPVPAPVPAPAPAPAPAPSSAALIGAPVAAASWGAALSSNIAAPLVYTSYPPPLPLAGYIPSSPYIYKSYIY
ncbi:uncharacterized protein LOC117604654 [Osmia lignaria lignaria]|uniref:uncharacterized protein LOC117604654 n=1 Tax=Osmia lignaria lignaria TaxID=1437193 RepID=UPI00402BA337